jgi:hypothetical protein
MIHAAVSVATILLLVVSVDGTEELDADGHDEQYVHEYMPDVNEGFLEDPHGYNAERDMLGFNDEEVDAHNETLMEEKFVAHFKEIDTNGDSFLDYNELDKRLRSAMLKRFANRGVHAKADAKKKMDQLDVNSDGKVSAEEWKVEYEWMGQLADEQMSHALADEDGTVTDEHALKDKQTSDALLKWEQKKFEIADRDLNGLDVDELLVLLQPEFSDRKEEMELKEAEHYIAMMDQDGSKTLTEAELKKGDPSSDQVFADIDSDGNGQLSAMEIKALHYPDMSDPKVHLAEVEEEIGFILTNLKANHEDEDAKTIKVVISYDIAIIASSMYQLLCQRALGRTVRLLQHVCTHCASNRRIHAAVLNALMLSLCNHPLMPNHHA